MYPEQLQKRRTEILAEAGMTDSELREQAREFMLPAELVVLAEELERIDYLLGD